MINAFSIQVLATLLDGTTTVLADQGTAQSGSVLEAFGGMPQKIAGLASDVNIKLGTLTNPLFLKVDGAEGVSVKIAESGTALKANPWLFIADTDNGLDISEIWVSNSEPAEVTITILAAE